MWLREHALILVLFALYTGVPGPPCPDRPAADARSGRLSGRRPLARRHHPRRLLLRHLRQHEQLHRLRRQGLRIGHRMAPDHPDRGRPLLRRLGVAGAAPARRDRNARIGDDPGLHRLSLQQPARPLRRRPDRHLLQLPLHDSGVQGHRFAARRTARPELRPVAFRRGPDRLPLHDDRRLPLRGADRLRPGHADDDGGGADVLPHHPAPRAVSAASPTWRRSATARSPVGTRRSHWGC